MDSREVFERNLGHIRKRSPQLARALELADVDGVEEFEGPRGARVLRERGVLLGSAYDPVREAEGLADRMAAEPADLMITIGFGLGEHLEPYLTRNPGTLIVYEPSLARLKAALGRRSFANLYATRRDFYIATDLDQFSWLIEARYVPGLRIQVFPHPAVLRLDREAVGRAVERARRVKEAADTRTVTSIDQMMPWARIVAGNGARIASRPSFSALMGSFPDRPAVVVAAGPSLDKQLPALREYRDRVLIIAIGQTVKALRAAGIEPHLVHVLESRNVAHQITEAGDSRDLNVVLVPDCHPAIFDVPTRTSFVATPAASPMGTWIGEARNDPRYTMGGGTVAQGAVGLAVSAGANPILLIGQDLAFTDGRAYASGSTYEFVGVEMNDDGSCAFTNQKRKVGLLGDRDLSTIRDTNPASEVIWVDAWEEGERVPTWRAYASFIEQYREIGLHLQRGGVRLINCTEGGARIPGLEHRAFAPLLEEVAREPLDAEARIVERHAAAPTHGIADFRAALADSRRQLDSIERDVRKARRFARRVEPRIANPRSEQQKLEVLRGLARFEKKLRRRLEHVPWLDALVQPEIYNAIAAVRRTERLDPSLEDLYEESCFLFDAAGHGIERARDWLDRFEASFGEPAEAPPPSPPRPGPPAPGPAPGSGFAG